MIIRRELPDVFRHLFFLNFFVLLFFALRLHYGERSADVDMTPVYFSVVICGFLRRRTEAVCAVFCG